MKEATKTRILDLWDKFDEDKSIEYIFEMIASITGVRYDRVVDCIIKNRLQEINPK